MLIINSNSNIIRLISNYVGKIWNLLSVFLFIPLYIHYLGIENYAVIGFYSLVLGIISFADAGMSSAITREFALDENASIKYHILKKIEIIYWSIIVTLSIIIICFSGFISKVWLTSATIPSKDLNNYVMLIGVGTSIQLLSSLYFGALFGLGEQLVSNLYQIVWTTLKSLFVIVLFIIIDENLYVFFIWQIICNIIYVITLRMKVISNLNKQQLHFISLKKPLPDRILKYIAGMTVVAIISSINSQSDKLVISYFFPLKVFGYYSMVSALAQIPVLVTVPLASFVFPILSKFAVKEQDKITFLSVFQKFSFLLNLVIIPLSIVVCFFSLELLLVWAKNAIEVNLYHDLSLLLVSLIIGSLFLAIQFPFYYVLLAKSRTKYTVYQGIIQISIGVPLLVLCAKYYGLKFVGIPWIIINCFAFFYLGYICIKKFLHINFFKYIKNYLVPNLAISLIFSYLGYSLYTITHWHFLIFLILSLMLSFVSILLWDNYLCKRGIFSYHHLYDFPRG